MIRVNDLTSLRVFSSVIARSFTTKQSRRLPRLLRSLAMTMGFFLAMTLIFMLSGSLVYSQNFQDELDRKQDQIQEAENKLEDLQQEQKSLKLLLSYLDGQSELTQLKIEKATLQKDTIAASLEKEAEENQKLKNNLDSLTRQLEKEYKTSDGIPVWNLLFPWEGFGKIRERYLALEKNRLEQEKLLSQLHNAQKFSKKKEEIIQQKQKNHDNLESQLVAYQQDLLAKKEEKQSLLAETQNSEEVYQKLLSDAKEQLDGFSQFTQSQGGAGIIEAQTQCDDWGCYYNQRDSQWGAVPLNRTKYSLASDGCLVTAIAMVYTHYGYRNVTPLTINNSKSNFALYAPAWVKKQTAADSIKLTRTRSSGIDQELAKGNPLIIGISYDGGPLPDHFVVLISGSNGNYLMNDPFTPNGHNIPFTSKYRLKSIKSVEKVTISSI